MKRVCVIGNFSGRNTGDAAILGGLLEDLDGRYGGLRYDVPTINPSFVRRTYAGHAVRPVGLLPWNLSAKIFGLPVFASALRSDLVLVTDAILFDLRLFNPLFNYLSTMALVLPAARRAGIPVVLYNVSLGPVRTAAGRACMRRVIDASAKIIVRDAESLEVIRTAGRDPAGATSAADCALNVEPAPAADVDRILRGAGIGPGEPVISFNVNSYLDVFVRGGAAGVDAAGFAALMAEAADMTAESLGVRILFVITQPMDTRITAAVMSRMRRRDRASLVSNSACSYREIAGVLSRVGAHVGMRTHSLILASAALTPVVGIIATPKNRGYMLSIEQRERMIEFPDLTAGRLAGAVRDTWARRDAIRAEMAPVIRREKEKARASAAELAPYLEGGTE